MKGDFQFCATILGKQMALWENRLPPIPADYHQFPHQKCMENLGIPPQFFLDDPSYDGVFFSCWPDTDEEHSRVMFEFLS